MEDLSDVSFLGKLLVLPANIRLDWNVLPGPNTLAYLASSVSTKKKSLITLTPGAKVIKLFSSPLTLRANKLVCLVLVGLVSLDLYSLVLVLEWALLGALCPCQQYQTRLKITA